MPQASPYVTMRSPRTGHLVDFPRENAKRMQLRGWIEVKAPEEKKPEEEGMLPKIGRELVLGPLSGAGVAETQTPVEDTLKNLKSQIADMFAPDIHPLSGEAWERSLMANPAVAIPRGLAKGGSEVIGDVLELGTSYGNIKLNKNIDIPKTVHDIGSMLTQLLMLKGGKSAVEKPIRSGIVAKTAEGAAKGGAREFLGVSERAEKAARAESEATAKEQLGKHAEKVEEAKAKDVEKLETVKQKKAQEVAENLKERKERSIAETKKSSLGVMKDRLAGKVAENIDLAEKREEASLNQRYRPYNAVIDKGQFDLAPLEEAINESRKDILKGTVTNEPIFNSILSRIKEKVELPSGETRAVAGQNLLRGDQFRGYIKELGDAMYKSAELPADIYKALKNVREQAKAMVQSYVDDTMGKQGGQGYRQLQKDWSHYEQTWYDRQSGSPLRNALKVIRTAGRNVSVYREVANHLLREVKGEQALEWLGKKKQFGADPNLVAQLRRVDREMKAVKVPGEPREVEKPTFPKPTGVKPPDIKQFDPEAWRREKVLGEGSRLSTASGWDVAALGYALREIVKGRFPWGLTYPVGKRLLDAAVSNPKILNWLVKQ